MPSGLFILCFLGGFMFMSRFNYTEMLSKKLNGQRLIIFSAIIGVLLAGFSRVTVLLILELDLAVVLLIKQKLFPFPFLGTATMSFFLGFILPIFLNFIFDTDKAFKYTLKKYANGLEQLFANSIIDDKQVMVNLKNGKVYVGYMSWQPPSSDANSYYRILPVISGYRAAESHEVTYVTDYTPIYLKLADDDKEATENLSIDDFQKYFSLSDVSTACIYDPDVDLFFGVASDEDSVEAV
ncbi:MAG: hypothetical protein ACI9WC_002378 [Arenicella sp.]|jgi:hypothetical protein